MRYCMTLYLKEYQKYDSSKLKRLDLLNKSRFFNFDLWYRVIQYLIEKLLDVVNMSQEG